MPDLPFFPTEGSGYASGVDLLFLFMLAVSFVIVGGIGTLIVIFIVRYRRKSEDEVPEQIVGSTRLELAWTLIPLGLVMIPFFWGSYLYLQSFLPPANSEEVYVVAKQWMWKFQHADGQSEINELHVPVGRPIRLSMTSQDVIHSFFVPDFRIKQDVLPERYTTTWFQASKVGQYHLFCAQYCGTNHSQMVGWVYVMEPAAYEAWLAGGASSAQSPAQAGSQLFQQYGCSGCHHLDGSGVAPTFVGLYNHPVQLSNGQTVIADDNYIHESIVNPGAKVVRGYQNIMPSFQGRLSEEQILQIIAFIRSLASPTAVPGQPPSNSSTGPATTPGAVPAGTPAGLPTSAVPAQPSNSTSVPAASPTPPVSTTSTP